MRKLLIGSWLILVYLTTTSISAAELDKLSLNIHLRTHRGQPEWRWTPKINFDIQGKMADSAALSVELTLPTGKQFVTLKCEDNGGAEDENSNVEDCGNNLEAESATPLTGIFGIQIKLTDELNRINKTLYSGKFAVEKFLFNPAQNPAFNKNFYYYINYDWRLTTAYIGAWKDEYTPKQLFTWVWIKGDMTSPDCKAYLTYKGKPIDESSYGQDMTYAVDENDAVEFSRLRFRFKALFAKPESLSYESWWKLYENPGDYEIKVLRKGELTRTIKFSIDSNAKVVESGIGKEIKVGYGGIIVPTQISGTADGALNQTVFKSGWWSNPITGILQ